MISRVIGAITLEEVVSEVHLLTTKTNHLNSAQCSHDVRQQSKGTALSQKSAINVEIQKRETLSSRRCFLLKEPSLKSLETGPRAFKAMLGSSGLSQR